MATLTTDRRAVGAPMPGRHASTPDTRTPRDHDLCDARPGGRTERLGMYLAALHPLVAGGVVVATGFLILAALVVGLGVLLTDVLLPGDLQHWDGDVVRSLARGRPTYDTASLVGSYLAEFVTVLVVGGALVAVCAWKHWWSLAALFVTAIGLEGLVYVTATYFVTRTRPGVLRLEHLIVSDSYPSGHVAAGAVLWIVIALVVCNATHHRLTRVAVITAAALVPIVVALSRMYRGMHHPTDAIVGYVIGWACVGVALTAVRTAKVVRARRQLAEEQTETTTTRTATRTAA